MTILIPSASEATDLSFMLGAAVPGNQLLKLFVSNTTLADTTIASDLTEMSTLGYAAKTLTKTSWTVTAGATGAAATAVYAAQTWTFTSGTAVTAYGYYVVDSTTGLLLWAETFASAKVLQNTGDTITITPTITASRSA